MSYFPLFIELEGASCLVVGGGKVALRKVEKLLPYGPRICVVAESFLPDFSCFSSVECIERAYQVSDLDNRVLVIAATDDEGLNQTISETCHERSIPINVVDDKEKCSFLFPALIKRGPLSIGISSGGSSPSAARYFKDLFEAVLPKKSEEGQLGFLLSSLAEQRSYIKNRVSDEKMRALCFESAFQEVMRLGRALEDSELERLVSMTLGAYDREMGQVTLLGAGCGLADWLTLRGLRAILSAEVIVHDTLIDPILLTLNSKAQLFPVGKRAGKDSMTQEEINALLIELTQKGHDVLRLKGGDPFVFGRGGEEALALKKAGVSCVYIPGISSAIAIPGEAGIPITHRGMSRSFHVMTAHTADELQTLVEEASVLASLKGTLVFLMGFSRLEEITSALVAGGKNKNTPVAVVSGGSSEYPQCVRGTLFDIARRVRAAAMKAPAVIVVGEVAELDLFENIY